MSDMDCKYHCHNIMCDNPSLKLYNNLMSMCASLEWFILPLPEVSTTLVPHVGKLINSL